MTNITPTLTWSHKVTAGSLEIWTSNSPEIHATVEYYERSISHWFAIQAAVKDHGNRGPVLQLTGPQGPSETQCRGVFVISHPGPFTIAALSIDLDDGRSALVQMYQADNDWFDTDYRQVLEHSNTYAQSLLETPQ